MNGYKRTLVLAQSWVTNTKKGLVGTWFASILRLPSTAWVNDETNCEVKFGIMD